MNIGRAGSEDLAEVRSLLANREWAEDLDPNQGHIYIASDPNVIGCLQVIELGERFGVLDFVLVDEQRRREGVGTALVEAARAKHHQKLYLSCRPDAVRFYETLGFSLLPGGLDQAPDPVRAYWRSAGNRAPLAMEQNAAAVDLRRVWASRAAQWTAWARAPEHDAYWHYSLGFLEAIVPPPQGLTLEVGCGEGRVARDLTQRGHTVVAIDSSHTLLASAIGASAAVRYVQADATRLPFGDATFDCVVAYNSLQDVNDMRGAVREASRVLRPNGALCICVVHPIRDAGQFASNDPGAQFIISGSYFEERLYEERFDRDGLEMTFTSWRYPIEAYSRALEDAGFTIEQIREPLPAARATRGEAVWARSERLPLFLFLRAIKGPRPAARS